MPSAGANGTGKGARVGFGARVALAGNRPISKPPERALLSVTRSLLGGIASLLRVGLSLCLHRFSPAAVNTSSAAVIGSNLVSSGRVRMGAMGSGVPVRCALGSSVRRRMCSCSRREVLALDRVLLSVSPSPRRAGAKGSFRRFSSSPSLDETTKWRRLNGRRRARLCAGAQRRAGAICRIQVAIASPDAAGLAPVARIGRTLRVLDPRDSRSTARHGDARDQARWSPAWNGCTGHVGRMAWAGRSGVGAPVDSRSHAPLIRAGGSLPGRPSAHAHGSCSR